MRRLVACLAVMSCLTSCTNIPYIGRIFDTRPVERVSEEAIEDAIESAADAAGRDVHIEVDIDPSDDPSCMHCPLHCPKDSTSCVQDIVDGLFPLVEPELDDSSRVA